MSHLPHRDRKKLIERDNDDLSLTQQADLLNISRANLYYQPVIDQQDIVALNALDAIYTDCPFYGSRRMRYELNARYYITMCREHIQRLMRLMGLEAIYPKKYKRLSDPNDQHKKYPYLLTDITASFSNHIWGTDITYVRMETGFAYLVALLDWFSRYVIAWQLSPNLEIDNIFTERLWRRVKYENVFLKSYHDIAEAEQGLTDYFQFYNTKRPHQFLGNMTPAAIYFKNQSTIITN